MNPFIAIPAIAAIVYRAWSRQSLTSPALLVAALTAVAHALHPWSVFFALLGVFFLTGTAVTKAWPSALLKFPNTLTFHQVKHQQKSLLTLSSTGGHSSASTPPPRVVAQVLANSLCATVLITVHWISLSNTTSPSPSLSVQTCLPVPSSWSTKRPLDILPVAGILGTYASVAADTFSSELGILSPSPPILLTDVPAALLTLRAPRRVPPGTNGGVTITGLAAGGVGAGAIGVTAAILVPFCAEWSWGQVLGLVLATTLWGTLGSVVDSLLGGWLQASVVDGRLGKVIEGAGGGKVLFGVVEKSGKGSGRRVVSGRDLLSNNGVNFVMALLMALGAVAVVSLWFAVGVKL